MKAMLTNGEITKRFLDGWPAGTLQYSIYGALLVAERMANVVSQAKQAYLNPREEEDLVRSDVTAEKV